MHVRARQSATELLLRESRGIEGSLMEADSVLRKANAAQESLLRQRGLISNASSTLRAINERVPALGKLMKRAQCYKNRDSFILAFVIASLMIFTFLYKTSQ